MIRPPIRGSAIPSRRLVSPVSGVTFTPGNSSLGFSVSVPSVTSMICSWPSRAIFTFVADPGTICEIRSRKSSSEVTK